MKKYGAEFFGTFWLVLGGCGSAVLAAAFPNVGIGLLGACPALAFLGCPHHWRNSWRDDLSLYRQPKGIARPITNMLRQTCETLPPELCRWH